MDLTGIRKQQPCIFGKPVFTAAGYVIVAHCGIASGFKFSLLGLRGSDNRQIVALFFAAQYHKIFVSLFAIGELVAFPVENAAVFDLPHAGLPQHGFTIRIFLWINRLPLANNWL